MAYVYLRHAGNSQHFMEYLLRQKRKYNILFSCDSIFMFTFIANSKQGTGEKKNPNEHRKKRLHCSVCIGWPSESPSRRLSNAFDTLSLLCSTHSPNAGARRPLALCSWIYYFDWINVNSHSHLAFTLLHKIHKWKSFYSRIIVGVFSLTCTRALCNPLYVCKQQSSKHNWKRNIYEMEKKKKTKIKMCRTLEIVNWIPCEIRMSILFRCSLIPASFALLPASNCCVFFLYIFFLHFFHFLLCSMYSFFRRGRA